MTTTQEIRVMTYNVRTAGASDGVHAWALRKGWVATSIRAFDPDVIGLQEAMPEQVAYLTERLSGYDTWARSSDALAPVEEQEAKLIAWRRVRFSRLDAGTFELSQACDLPHSDDWDSKHRRWVEWVQLRPIDRPPGGDGLFVFNTHFDNVGVHARRESSRLLRRKIAEITRGAAVIVLGDFNCAAPDTEPFALLTAAESAALADPAPHRVALRLLDAWGAVHPGNQDDATFNGFGGPEQAFGRIDWVLHTPHFSPVEAIIDRSRFSTADHGVGYPSDHDPVKVTLRYDFR